MDYVHLYSSITNGFCKFTANLFPLLAILTFQLSSWLAMSVNWSITLNQTEKSQLLCSPWDFFFFKNKHCQCEHVSMLMLAFSSKHHCNQVHPHRAASVAVDSTSCLSTSGGCFPLEMDCNNTGNLHILP